MSAKPKIGFVGVGRMGSNMARRLHDLGYPIAAIYDAHAELARTVATELDAQATTSLARVTDLSDVIFTVVTDDAAMHAIFETPGDNLFSGAAGKLVLNCATVSPSVHLRIEEISRSVGADVLETCMASSIPQARNGTLYLMCAGRREVYTRAEPLLLEISQARAYTGPTGTASQLKALVNMVMNINTAGLAEGLGLADALGLDLNTVLEVFSQTGANSRVLQTDGADMVKREHRRLLHRRPRRQGFRHRPRLSRAQTSWTSRSPPPPRSSTTASSPSASANSTNPDRRTHLQVPPRSPSVILNRW